MSYNNQFFAGSLLAIPVSATPGTPTQQPSTPSFDLPKVDILPAGHYDSVIVDAADAVQNGQVVGLDCFHQLTNSDGTTYNVRFRYYAPREVDALVETVASYGLSGSLGSLLQGLQESVDVAPKANSRTYQSITHRAPQATTQTATASSSTTPLATTATPATGSSTTTNALPRKTGGLASRVLLGHQHKLSMSQRTSLISEDDDDDEDDLLDEDED